MVECQYCKRKFEREQGLVVHLRTCFANPKNAKLPDDPLHKAILEPRHKLRERLLSLLKEGYIIDGLYYGEGRAEGSRGYPSNTTTIYTLTKDNQRYKLEEIMVLGTTLSCVFEPLSESDNV